MNKMLIIVVALTLLVSGCSSINLSEHIDLKLHLSKTQQIDFGDKVSIDYTISSLSKRELPSSDYEITISKARPGETSREIITDISKTVPAQNSVFGTFNWNIDGIPGSGGEFDIYLTFYEKFDGGVITIKETSQRISFIMPVIEQP